MSRNNKKEGLEDMVNKEMSARAPRILTIDIENSPILGYSWGPVWETSILHIKEDSKILSYSAKWLGGKQETKALPDYKGYKKGVLDDEKIVRDLHKLLDQADIVVGHNSSRFDIKKINARFIYYGLKPPSPYKQVDTLSESKKITLLPSNKLNEVTRYFEVGGKLEHEGFGLWLKCMAGDEKAWNKMRRYNAQDTKMTEKIYTILRPYMKSHPNVGTYLEKCACPKCGGEDLQRRGFAKTVANVYQRVQCQSCGSWSRLPTSEKKYKTTRSI